MAPETPIVFDCAGERLIGILHSGATNSHVGVIIVVGGPQYRVGSHRQFVIMARHFAAAGIPVFRFDFRGMGDAEGEQKSFEAVDDDIRSAMDCFVSEVPTLDKIILLGLCDAASANLMYCQEDRRVSGLILLNPWARSVRGHAKSYLHYYYIKRIFQKSFWVKILTGKFLLRRSIGEFLEVVGKAFNRNDSCPAEDEPGTSNFVDRMQTAFLHFGGPILVVISGRDLTAGEFMDVSRQTRQWRKAIQRSNVTVFPIPRADHTFSDVDNLCVLNHTCVEWIEARL